MTDVIFISAKLLDITIQTVTNGLLHRSSGNATGTLAFGNLMGNPSTGLHTYTIPSADQGQVRYFVMSGYGGQNASWSQQVTLVKTYNQNNP